MSQCTQIDTENGLKACPARNPLSLKST